MFVKTRDGVIWINPQEEDTEKFLSELESNEIAGPTVEKRIVDQLNAFASATLEGAAGLSQANRTLLSTIGNLSSIEPVDIILPIYNGLHVFKPCIDSVLQRTNWPYHLHIIDDCSPDKKVQDYLKRLKHPNITVHKNKMNKGFAATVNRGIKLSSNKYVCLLNSDVIVTPNWLIKMVLTLEADKKHAIVNPVTNNTALINIPMHPGLSYLDMNLGLESVSHHKHPEIMPTGFCFLFRRSLVDELGYFDESYQNFGEESDWWMRTISHVKADGTFPRYKSVLADNTYVFHERGSSYAALGEEAHIGHRNKASTRFNQLWPGFKQWRKYNKLENNISYLKQELPSSTINKESPYNIAFFVFSTAYCGGMAYIADVVNELQEQGVNAKVVYLVRDPSQQPTTPLSELRCGPVVFRSPDELVNNFKSSVFESGVVVSATNEIVPVVKDLCSNNPDLTHVLFSQSFDPGIAPTVEKRETMTKAYHDVPYIISGSKWLDDSIRTLTKRSTLGWVRPGVNTDLFYERDRSSGDDRPTVAIILKNTNDKYRGFDRGIRLAFALNEKAESDGVDLRIIGIGPTAISGANFITCTGVLSQSRMASFLANEVDILVDPCHLHSYGMPSLEAMASGCVPACWDNVGIQEFAKDGVNSIIVNRDAHEKELARKIIKTLKDPTLLKKLKKNAVKVDQKRDESVKTFIKTLESGLNLRREKRSITVVTPHMRKHGGPTTILKTADALKELGHSVKLVSVYPDISPRILNDIQHEISVNWKDIEPCDVLIVNSDNPHTDHFVSLPQAKKKVLLKLSHNARFKELEEKALTLPWDKILTSTQWLVDVCKNPTKGWNYPPCEATRVGWYHYDHEIFKANLAKRMYFLEGKINIGTLIHQHPLKGTDLSFRTMETLSLNPDYGNLMRYIGVGELPTFRAPPWLKYYLNLDRSELASVFQNLDIFISMSQTEGLGRMALEAMSAGVLVAKTNTNAEFAVDGENCILGNTPEELSEKILKVINDKEKFQSIIINGYETAQKYADKIPYVTRLGDEIDALFS